MHNLGTVFRFELRRTLNKRSFWIAALSFPLLIGVVGCVIYFSNQATDKATNDANKQTYSIGVTDDSKLITPSVLAAVHATSEASKAAGIAAVKNGTLDAYFYYPQDLASRQIEVYGKEVGLFKNSRYESSAKNLLQASVAKQVSPEVRSVLQDKLRLSTATYTNGALAPGIKALFAPGIFLLLFYFLIALFGSRMLNSTTEEKENRVIEMILTTVQPRALIVGKILSLVVLGFLQVFVLLIPVAAAYALLHSKLALPNLDLSNIPLDPVRIGVGAVLFILSFLLFTGLLVAISSMAPTAKDAGSFFGVIMLLLFAPLYAVTLFVSSPGATIVKVLSFFPLTAPIPLLLRNAVGNLSVGDTIIAIIILSMSVVAVMAFAIRAFRYGALEYSRRLSFRELFRRN